MRIRDKMSRFPRQEWKNKVYDKRGRDRDSKRASNTNDRGRSDSRRPDKNSNGERKSPPERKSDKDFKPCHLHGAESKHSYDECRNNPKNFAKTNKSNDYVKKRGNDAHYYDARRPSNGEDSPTGNDTDVQSDDEIEDEVADDVDAVARKRLATLSRHQPAIYSATKAALRPHFVASPDEERAFIEDVIPVWCAPALKAGILAMLSKKR